MLGGLVRKILTAIVAPIMTAAMTVLSTVHVAFAANTDASLPPEYVEMLRLTAEKVRVATQPGAFGNGVPLMNLIRQACFLG